jgi:uncharacterized membrane protein
LSPGSHAPRAAAGIRALLARWLDWAAQHQILCLILFTSFVARLFIADWKSYWYDEILSVGIYGVDNATLGEALGKLAERSAHPPLFHVILYYWMKLFGDGEAATRTLSNLYIAGATLCLYLLAFRLFGRRVAIAAALLFAFSGTAFFFGLEVRSYAQSLFLVTLSALLLWRWLDRAEGPLTWRDLFVGRAALLVCNIALLLTHYSNALFLIVQLLFVGFYAVHSRRFGETWRALAKLAAFYATQFAVFIAIWGPVALSTERRFARREQFSLEGLPSFSPPHIFLDSVVRPSFNLSLIVIVAVLACLALVLLRRARRYFLRAGATPPLNQYFLLYLAAWTGGPAFLVWLGYLFAGWERYNARYFAICIPPFVILLVLALEQFVELVALATRKLQGSIRRHYVHNALLYALVACAIFSVPGAHQASEQQKGRYRDIARAIVQLVEQDPESRFAIFEGAPRRKEAPLEFYLKRLSKQGGLRVDAIVRKTKKPPSAKSMRRLEAKLADRDYLIAAFPFRRAVDFQPILDALGSRHSLVFSQIDRAGRGFLVFKVKPGKDAGDASAGNAAVPAR